MMSSKRENHTCTRMTSVQYESKDEHQGYHGLQSPYHTQNKEIGVGFHTDFPHESVEEKMINKLHKIRLSAFMHIQNNTYNKCWFALKLFPTSMTSKRVSLFLRHVL